MSMKLFIEGDNYKIDGKEIEKLLLQEFLYRLVKLK